MTVRCPQPQLRDLDSPLSEAAPPLATEWSDVGGLVMSRFARTDRAYIPIAFIDENLEASHETHMFTAPATLFRFGVLSSGMFATWVRLVGTAIRGGHKLGEQEYLNFPWPFVGDAVREVHARSVERYSQKVLDVCARYSDSTFCDLYSPEAMPADLRDAHRQLDAAVDGCYSCRSFNRAPELRANVLARRHARLTGGRIERFADPDVLESALRDADSADGPIPGMAGSYAALRLAADRAADAEAPQCTVAADTADTKRLADAMAVMAFVPGGIKFMGTRFEANPRPDPEPALSALSVPEPPEKPPKGRSKRKKAA